MNTIVKGGAWGNTRLCRSAYQSANNPGNQSGVVGFRTIIDPQPQRIRGGCVWDFAEDNRAAFQHTHDLWEETEFVGFRTVL